MAAWFAPFVPSVLPVPEGAIDAIRMVCSQTCRRLCALAADTPMVPGRQIQIYCPALCAR